MGVVGAVGPLPEEGEHHGRQEILTAKAGRRLRSVEKGIKEKMATKHQYFIDSSPGFVSFSSTVPITCCKRLQDMR